MATEYSFRDDMNRRRVKRRKRRKENIQKQRIVIAFKWSKMILPSILSEASSLVAKRENKGEERNRGKRLT